MKNLRLTGKHAFADVFANARKVRNGLFLAYCQKNTDLHAMGTPKLGIMVKKAAVPSAVKRNQIRRVIKESFRHRIIANGSISLLAIIVSVQSQCGTLDKKTLRTKIDQLWDLISGNHN